jgi:hypothetical protein
VRVIATLDQLAFVLLFPNGRDVVYAAGSELRTMDLDGRPGKLLLSGDQKVARFRPLAIAGTGRFILYLAIGATTPPVRTFRVLDVETLQTWPLLPSEPERQWALQETSWSPDGSFLVLAADVAPGLH